MGGHQLGRLVAFGAAGVPDAVVVHPKTATHKNRIFEAGLRRGGSGQVIGTLNASPQTLHLSAGGRSRRCLGQSGEGLTQLHYGAASKPLQGIFSGSFFCDFT